MDSPGSKGLDHILNSTPGSSAECDLDHSSSKRPGVDLCWLATVVSKEEDAALSLAHLRLCTSCC